jgi:hypothetical protein
VRITPAERVRVRQKLACAFARIEHTVPRMAAVARREAGLPNLAAARRLARGLRLVATLELERAPRGRLNPSRAQRTRRAAPCPWGTRV